MESRVFDNKPYFSYFGDSLGGRKGIPRH